VTLRSIAILGAGAWGTALAKLWSEGIPEIILWGHDPVHLAAIQSQRENRRHLPGVKLPPAIRLTSDVAECDDVDLVVFVTPSTALRTVAEQMSPHLRNESTVLISCTKGIEHGTGMRMSEILSETFPHNPIAALSGPNLAAEVVRAMPTASVIASAQSDCALALQPLLSRARFRVYTAEDLAGVELGGALKNIFAIAAGASDGLGLGDNTKAALVTRALAEMTRLGTALGGSEPTFYGLSGAGDLIATCFSKLSRNRRVGEELARGHALTQITESMRTVAEGIPTTRSVFARARVLNIDTPILDQVYALLYEGRSPAAAMEELLGRDPKPERR
jgi:glycerol-3-phosphate dehydrogenase (NAD(P)+)